jgi:hypothetical protein
VPLSFIYRCAKKRSCSDVGSAGRPTTGWQPTAIPGRQDKGWCRIAGINEIANISYEIASPKVLAAPNAERFRFDPTDGKTGQ